MTASSPPPRRPPARPAARRRVSRRRYLARRLGAAALLVILAIGLVRVGGALVGSDGTTSASLDPATSASSTGSADAADATGASSSTPTDSSAATGTQPAVTGAPAGGVPTAADPATLLIAGDSDAGTFGPYLQTLLADTGVVSTQLDYKVSSGLSRPDFFDWPAHFRETIPSVSPDIVVVTFGGNDPQGLSIGDGTFIVQQPTGEPGGDVEWRTEYGKRVGEVMDYLAAEGRTLIWVGIPNDDNPDVTARLTVQNEVVMAEAAKRPEVLFVDTWKRFSGRQGGWAEYVIDPRDGLGKDVRADDGFHLNTTGAEILALDIAEVVTASLRRMGADI